jgi:hypothetical protein
LRSKLFDPPIGASWSDFGETGLELVLMVVILSIPLIAMWTLAMIPIRLLGPRPGIAC